MKEFLCGKAILLGGVLRVLPAPAAHISVKDSVRSAERLLEMVEEHIRAGRLPVLKDSTKSRLFEKAKERELRIYGGYIRSEQTGSDPDQGSLF